METAEMYDRIHLRTTYYNYAKFLEGKGELNEAIPKYAKQCPYFIIYIFRLHTLEPSYVLYAWTNKNVSLKSRCFSSEPCSK